MQVEEQKTIFEQLGGAPPIDIAVDKFYDRVLADPVVNHFFKNTNMSFQRKHQKNFITYATGGSNVYAGKNMREAHKDMGLEDIHFDHIKMHLGDTLTDLGVQSDLVDNVLNLVETLRNDVLGR